MKLRRNIYVGAPLASFLDSHGCGKDDSLQTTSGAISRMADRYAAILACARPRLSLDAWREVCYALRGWSRDATAVDLIVHELDRQASHPPTPAQAEARAALTGLDYAGLVAALDIAERFWARPEDAIEDVLRG